MLRFAGDLFWKRFRNFGAFVLKMKRGVGHSEVTRMDVLHGTCLTLPKNQTSGAKHYYLLDV